MALSIPRCCKNETGELNQFLGLRKEDGEYEKFNKGAMVWFRPKKDEDDEHVIYRPGCVKVAFDRHTFEEGLIIYKENGIVREVKVTEEMALSIVRMDQSSSSSSSPSNGLELVNKPQHFGLGFDISEPALLHAIRLRFANGFSYLKLFQNTLLFLNQTFETDILSLSTAKDEDLDETLATVVRRSFERLNSSKGKECTSIIVNGDNTNSSKRDVTRFILLRAIQEARPTNIDWWRKLMAGDLLLQAFGGANGFLRWTELKMLYPTKKKGFFAGFGRSAKKKDDEDVPRELLGAVQNAFGLQDSRITSVEYDMFPIFYCLFSSLAKSQFDTIDDVATYNYMKRSSVKKQTPLELYDEGCEEDDCDKPHVGDGYCEEHGPGDLQAAQTNPAAASRGWRDLIDAFKTLNMQDGLDDLVQTLVGILDVGNIDFQEIKEDLDDDVKAKLEADQAKEDGDTKILGVKLTELRAAFKIKRLVVKNEVFLKERPFKEKYAVRDGLARYLYSNLFNFILYSINRQVECIDEVVQQAMLDDDDTIDRSKKKGKAKQPKGTVGMVGVLETAALQCKKSSLDELYDNYRLERFHSFYSDQVVKANADLLAEQEGLKGLSIPPGQNDLCISLLVNKLNDNSGGGSKQQKNAFRSSKRRTSGAKPPRRESIKGLGILQMIDEELTLRKGSDKSLLKKFNTLSNKHNKVFRQTGDTEFTIQHFGGPVSYEILGFVGRSRTGMVPLQVLEVLKTKSSNKVVRRILAMNRNQLLNNGNKDRENDDLSSLLSRMEKEQESTGDEDEMSGKVANVAKRVSLEMDRAISILGRSQVEFVFTLSPSKTPDETIDSEYILDQMRRLGISGVCQRMYNALRKGTDAKQFLQTYGAFDRKISNVKTLCDVLQKSNLITGPYQIQDKVFVGTSSYFSLDTAMYLLQNDVALYLQRYARRFLARMELIRLKHEQILEELEEAIEESSEKDIKHSLQEATKWALQHSLVTVGNKRLERLAKEKVILTDLEKAMEEKKCTTLYKTLQNAKEIGMTGNDFPEVRSALELLHKLENTVVSKEDKEELGRKFALVAEELKRRSD